MRRRTGSVATQEPSGAAWLPLHRELFAISLDPYTLREVGRGSLPVGVLVEDGASIVRRAEAQRVLTVTVRVRANEAARQVDVVKVNVEDLRGALGP
jgi:hypothetical protein